MKSVGLFEAKTKLSAVCAEVAESDESVIITRRGKPWVRIEPIENEQPTIRERRAEYMARYGPEERPDDVDFVPPARKDRPRKTPLEY